jgi:hypothetical protein
LASSVSSSTATSLGTFSAYSGMSFHNLCSVSFKRGGFGLMRCFH